MTAMFRLLGSYPYILSYCFLSIWFGGPGQTYVLSFFIPHISKEFELSASTLGLFYSVATVVSALMLPFFGRLLDRISLVHFTLMATFFFTAGYVLLFFNRWTFLIVVAFVLIRASGQGLFTFVGRTTASREFTKARGKALAIAALGNLPAEMFFPLLAAIVAESFGWRLASLSFGGLILLIYLPIALFLLSRYTKRERATLRAEWETGTQKGGAKDQEKFEIRMDRRGMQFLLLAFTNACQPFLLTGFFYYQANVAEMKDWSLTFVASAFVGFGIARALFSVIVGPLIDLHSARKLYPLHLIPMLISLLTLYWVDHPVGAIIYLAVSGIGVGIAGSTVPALFAEIFGARFLGSIQGLASGMAVLATALSPAFFGLLLDYRISLPTLLIGSMFYTMMCIVSGLIATKSRFFMFNEPAELG